MKQKDLTKEQYEVFEKMNELFKEARAKGVGFIFDNDDCTLSLYNAENIEDSYAGREKEDDADELMNWDVVYVIDDRMDYFDSGMQSYYLHFKNEAV